MSEDAGISDHRPAGSLEISDEDFAASLEGLSLQPPCLRHQGKSDMLSPGFLLAPEGPLDSYPLDTAEWSPPRSRGDVGAGFSVPQEAYPDEEPPVYRSLGFAGPSTSLADEYGYDPYERGGPCFANELESARVPSCISWPSVASVLAAHAAHTPQPPRPAAAAPTHFLFELPADLFDEVLALLPASPDLFHAMRVSTAWRDAGRANYLARTATVPAEPDALLSAVAAAGAGDTLLLAPGVHRLSAELCIRKPLRLLSLSGETAAAEAAAADAADAEAADAPPADAGAPADAPAGAPAGASAPAARPSPCTPRAPSYASYRDAAAAGLVAGANAPTILTSTHHVLLRSRCTALVRGLTLCRMGEEVGYPNAVTYAEGGALSMEGCRLTCGGAATSLEAAMRAFNGAPTPGELWLPASPSSESGSECGSEGSGSPRPAARPGPVAGADGEQCPQSGVWVGAAASVELRRCTIARCMGPGVKIYRGRLRAAACTIAFSSRGANVVANGGHVSLVGNSIQGAQGDGISSWNNSVMGIERNTIHANSGAGIAVNTSGGFATIVGNAVYANAASAIFFATSGSAKQASLRDNELGGNGKGDVQGPHPSPHPSASAPSPMTPRCAANEVGGEPPAEP